jgi:aspartate-semialdehyde dehydrogenase
MVADVPMVIPEINPEHIQIIEAQRKRFGTKNGFVAVNPIVQFKAMFRPFTP